MPSISMSKPVISAQFREKDCGQPKQSIPKKLPQSQKIEIAATGRVWAALDELSFLRLPDVKAFTGLSKTSIYARIREKTFPAPIRLGPRSVAWVRSEIQQWAADRVYASRSAA